ncbi:50S ribosomal protein L1 [Candidatus Falkowbacteria bacterium]|nr:50S ribosomal protein L1 [Candidatus Falkowbacteria bacterium]
MRSKRYQEQKKQIEKDKVYTLDEALDLLKSSSKSKFDESVEIHLSLGIDPKDGEQLIRGSITLPHATGKTKKIAAFTSSPDKAKKAGASLAGGTELIDEIKKTEKTDFEVAVAEPALMKDLAKIARLLGPRGLMPTPKSGTVTPDIEKAIKELAAGKINFKNDDTANIHQLIGKISLDKEKLAENITAFAEAIEKARPSASKGEHIKSITLCTTMGPGIKISL